MENYIDLIVTDGRGEQVLFKVRPTQKMGVIFNAYSERMMKDKLSLLFKINRTNTYLSYHDNDRTISSFNLTHSDTITVE